MEAAGCGEGEVGEQRGAFGLRENAPQLPAVCRAEIQRAEHQQPDHTVTAQTTRRELSGNPPSLRCQSSRGFLGENVRPWALAVVLSITSCEPSATQSLDADRLPQIAGIGFTDSAATVRRALGPPDRQQAFLGFIAWDYERRGLTVMWDRDGGALRVVVLNKPAAGEVEGVRVGDSVARATRQWGSPVRTRQAGRFFDFVRRGLATSVEVRRGRIVEITLTAAAAQHDRRDGAHR